MRNETRKMFAEMIRACKGGDSFLIWGGREEVCALAARCGMAGPKGRLP